MCMQQSISRANEAGEFNFGSLERQRQGIGFYRPENPTHVTGKHQFKKKINKRGGKRKKLETTGTHRFHVFPTLIQQHLICSAYLFFLFCFFALTLHTVLYSTDAMPPKSSQGTGVWGVYHCSGNPKQQAVILIKQLSPPFPAVWPLLHCFF